MKICPKCGKEHDKNGTFCSRTCANSRTWTEEDKKKKSESVKKNFSINGHPGLGKPGWKHTDEDKELKRRKTIEFWDKKGRRTPEQLKLKNRLGVSRYRARLHNAIQPDSDMVLIDKIYELCPKGYEVDHIVALSVGGPHHQDNLQYLPEKENQRKNKFSKYNETLVVRWQDFIN